MSSGAAVREILHRWGTWAFGFGLVLLVAFLTANLLAKLVILLVMGYGALLPPVLASWRTILLLALLVLLWALWGRKPELPSRRHLRRHWLRWLLALLVVVSVAALTADSFRRSLFVGPLGFRCLEPHFAGTFDQDHPHRPPSVVRTNAYGYRDDEWAPGPRPGVTRVAVVGDSYVFGAGVPEEDGLVDRRLERELQRLAPERRWEVLNVGFPGQGYAVYFPLAEQVIETFRPRFVVIGSLGGPDWHLLGISEQIAAFGEPLFRVLHFLGVAEDLRAASLRYSASAASAADPAGADGIARSFGALLAAAERFDVDVVVWEYYEPFPFFATFRDHPRCHVTGWPEGFSRSWRGWSGNAELAVPGDGHPTARANALIAGHLAPGLLEALRSAR